MRFRLRPQPHGRSSARGLQRPLVVLSGEIGSINRYPPAEEHGCEVIDYQLETQSRCAGSEAFVNWVNNTLGIERTASILWEDTDGFDSQIFPDPLSLEEALRRKAAEGATARLTAGFSWDWSKKPGPDGRLALDVQIGDYRRPGNARPEATRWAKGIPKARLWAHHPGGLDQIGCPDTAQGFEFDYAGVIIGGDLRYHLDR